MPVGSFPNMAKHLRVFYDTTSQGDSLIIQTSIVVEAFLDVFLVVIFHAIKDLQWPLFCQKRPFLSPVAALAGSNENSVREMEF